MRPPILRALALLLCVQTRVLGVAPDAPPGGCQLGAVFDNSRCRPGAANPAGGLSGSLKPGGVTRISSYGDDKGGESWRLDTSRVESPAPQEPQPESEGGFLRGLGDFFGGIFNAVKNLGKLIIAAPVALVSNVVEGVAGGVRAAAKGDVLEAIATPGKVAMNAAWNTLNTGVAAMNVLSDPVWRLVKPQGEPEIDIERIDFGGSQRVLVTGGPLSHAVDATAFVTGSGYIVTPRASLDSHTLNHEYAHTLQFQRSFAVDFVARYIAEPHPAEEEAEGYARLNGGEEGSSRESPSISSRLRPGRPTGSLAASDTGFIARDRQTGRRYRLLASPEGTLHIRENGRLVPVSGLKREDLAPSIRSRT